MTEDDNGRRPVRTALLSVSDKDGVTELAGALAAQGVRLLSTGGTYARIAEAGIAVTEVSAHTGFPEMMDGRVKTLHPTIHGGILGRRDQDAQVMAEQGIDAIDLVVVNLYPFAATIADPECALADAIENIYIGGPAMLRSAAKNHADVAVVVNPADYGAVIEQNAAGGTTLALRRRLALAAFRHTAGYDATIAQYLGAQFDAPDALPERVTFTYDKAQDMRYGENPHQSAAFYVEPNAPAGTLGRYTQHQGKALSYNNIADTDAAWQCVMAFAEPSCVIVKHANPCGVASAGDLAGAYEGAFATDPTSAFGGIVAFNRRVDAALVETVLERQFVEVLIAPEVTPEAVAAAQRKKNVRLLSCGTPAAGSGGLDFKRVSGGLLLQTADVTALDPTALRVVSAREPTAAEHADMLFAWNVAWFVKSNAIVYAREQRTIGVGAGQMARVVSAKIASLKAQEEGLEVAGSVMASDAFFPFRDGIDAAASVGISAIIQPGGSVRDEEVIAAANEHDMAMLFTGMRHFRH